MTAGDELLLIIKKLVEQELSAELERHAKAGLPISDKQALEMANANQREKLIKMAEAFEKEGEEVIADLMREVADDLPELMRELGVT